MWNMKTSKIVSVVFGALGLLGEISKSTKWVTICPSVTPCDVAGISRLDEVNVLTPHELQSELRAPPLLSNSTLTPHELQSRLRVPSLLTLVRIVILSAAEEALDFLLPRRILFEKVGLSTLRHDSPRHWLGLQHKVDYQRDA
uniref:Uncharacterized protein n=1 Tax=Cacopsylla melanoneura TaxID=428564 RepID=A0A8D8S3Y5_9HEMI